MSASMFSRSFSDLSFAPERLEPRRLLSAGDLDLAFGTGGVTALDPAGPRASSLAILPDDRILVLATDPADANLPYVLRRYTSAGQLDTTFGGGDGQVEFALLSNLPARRSRTENSSSPPRSRKALSTTTTSQRPTSRD